MTLRDFADIHTHRPDAGPDALISVAPGTEMRPGRYYSVGIHPWDTDSPDLDRQLRRLRQDAALPRVIALGETGLDALRGADLERQQEVFREHVDLSEALRKPLIIHAVRTYNEIMRLRRALGATQPWIIHGFRGKPQLASQLLAGGIDISLGEHFNPAVPPIIPPNRLYTETDISTLPIDQIRSAIAAARP